MTEIFVRVERSQEYQKVKTMIMNHFQAIKDGDDGDLYTKNPSPIKKLDSLFELEGEEETEELAKRKHIKEPSCTTKHIALETENNKLKDASIKANSNGQTTVNINGNNECPPAENSEDKVLTAEKSESIINVVNGLKKELDKEGAEKKKILKELESLRKQVKDAEGKAKTQKLLQEKLSKTTTLKDQMSAAVQSLKQEKEVLLAQQETNRLTIDSQKDTLQSYMSIVANLEENLTAKEEKIKEQEIELKEKRIGCDLHRDLAYKFMEVASNDEDIADGNETEKDTAEIEKVYIQLRNEENKSSELSQELDDLKAECLKLRQQILEIETAAKEDEESLRKKILNEQKLGEENASKNKKDIGKLKEALNESERIRNTMNETIKNLESKVKEMNIELQVRQATEEKVDISREVQTEPDSSITTIQNILDEERKLRNKAEEELRVMSQSDAKFKEAEESLQASKRSISEMIQLLQQKDETISDLIDHGKFMDDSVKEKNDEVVALQTQIKENQKENSETLRNRENLESKHREVLKSHEELQYMYSSSQNQVEQLLFLNNQLKAKSDSLMQNHQQHTSKSITNPAGNKQPDTDTPPPTQRTARTERGNHNFCYDELKEKGSCQKKRVGKCTFSHEIPEMKDDERQQALTSIELKFICVNEFYGEGKCLKRGCRFNHNITDQQRADPAIIQMIETKMKNIRARGTAGSKRDEFCFFELKQKDGCKNGDQCRFNHDITEEQRNDSKLRAEIRLKYSSTRQQSLETSKKGKEKEGVTVPLDFLQKMYSWMEKATAEATTKSHF